MGSQQPHEIHIGLIGFGFIGKLHAKAYRSIPFAFPSPATSAHIQAVLRPHPGADAEFLQSLENPLVTSDPQEFYSQPLDAVDITSPNVHHHEQVLEALRHGKGIYCEKPLGRNLSDARAMADAASRSGAITHTAFMLRYIPAVRQMKAVIENGGIGEPFHFRGHTFHGSYIDALRPMSWRLRNSESGGGALADLGIHLMDLIHFLLGDATWVQCQTRTFITRRPVSAGSREMETVDVDDWALCQLGLKNGASGLIEVTRVAGGSAESCGLEIVGSRGTVKLDLSEPQRLEYYDSVRKQWLVNPQGFPPAANLRPIETLWPPSKQSLGTMLNAHLASCYDFLGCLAEDKPSPLNFQAALSAQEILEAAYRSADASGSRVQLPLP
jgi:predicted dehydrogenase